jgi:two-component system OmpR family sensor kinase
VRRALSIRARITLGSAAIALIVIVIAIVAIRVSAASILRGSDVTLATTDLASFEKDLIVNRGEHVDTPGTGILVLIRTPAGQTAVSTVPDEIRATIEKRPLSNSVFSASEDSAPYVVIAKTVKTPDGTWGLWAARSTGSSALVLDRLNDKLLLGGILSLLALTGASWLLATFALRPVSAMRRRAETLSGAGKDERLPVGPARDEIAALATTLNDFLDRVQDSTNRERRMVSDAAHELRTPLAALRTQLELAHDDFGDADALASEIIGAESSVERLTGLANGLLELSRLEGHADDIQPVTAAALVDESMGSVDRARMLALAKDVDVAFTTDEPDESLRYQVAPDAFARMLDNLLSNAVAAVEPGGTVELSLQTDGGVLEIEVRDDGPGVPSDFLPIAFDRFSRPDEARSSATGGSGLGLALVRAIAESAGGTADLRNSAWGAIATVRIPAVRMPKPLIPNM